MKKFILIILTLAFVVNANAQKRDYIFTLKTDKGSLQFVLYDETPLHKDNFINLVKQKFYDDLLFHRVIENFMIQGGDPLSRNAQAGKRLGSGGDDMERIPFEYHPKRYHKKGVIAAARDNNPEKKSSASQFYIVQGKKFNDPQLDEMEKRNGVDYTAEQRDVYKTLGGTPHLDKNYTVFGEVVGSLQLINDIARVETDDLDRPLEDQKMKITMKKMRKKKITRKYGFQY